MLEDPEVWVFLKCKSSSSFPLLQQQRLTFFILSIPAIHVMQVTTDVLSRDGKDIAFGDYSATWRFHRKIVHGALCMFGEGSASIEKISKSACDISLSSVATFCAAALTVVSHDCTAPTATTH